MPQSLTQLPETAEFEIGGWRIIIRNHKYGYVMGLFGTILNMIVDKNLEKNILCEFEKQGISWEMTVEYCAYELEHDVDVLAYAIRRNVEIQKNSWDETCDFLKSDVGRKIASQYIEKIRSCDNWRDLYDELNFTSQFQKGMYEMIGNEMRWEIKGNCGGFIQKIREIMKKA